MQFTLITKTGRVYTFYVQAVAELYQQIHGGNVVTADVLTPASTESAEQ